MRGQLAAEDLATQSPIDALACTLTPPKADAHEHASDSASLAAMRAAIDVLLDAALAPGALRRQLVRLISITAGPMPTRLALAMSALARPRTASRPYSAGLQTDLVRIVNRGPDEGRLTALLALYCTAGTRTARNDSEPLAAALANNTLRSLEPDALAEALIQASRLEWWHPALGGDPGDAVAIEAVADGTTSAAAAGMGGKATGQPVLARCLHRMLALQEPHFASSPSEVRARCLSHLMSCMCRYRCALDPDLPWAAFLDDWTDSAARLDSGRVTGLMESVYWMLRFVIDTTRSLNLFSQLLSVLHMRSTQAGTDAFGAQDLRKQAPASMPAQSTRLPIMALLPFAELMAGHLRRLLDEDVNVRVLVARCAWKLDRLLSSAATDERCARLRVQVRTIQQQAKSGDNAVGLHAEQLAALDQLSHECAQS